MKHSLTVAFLLTFAALAVLAMHAQAERKVAFSAGQGSALPTATSPSAAATQDGNALLAQAVTAMRTMPAVEAKLRLQTYMLGQELSGTGNYYQLTRPPETLFKLELKLQVANQVSSLLQISDGRFLWTRRDLPTQKFLGRVDQRRVTEALVAAGRQPPISPEAPLARLGGLPHALDSIAGHFDFAAPQAEMLGATPVWVLLGQWRPHVLALLWTDRATEIKAGQKVDLTQSPAHFPTRVMLVLARDPAQQLFPYRIEYQRVGSAGEVSTLMSLEYFEVRRNISLDPRLFAYKPGDQQVEDKTEDCLRSFGL